MSRKPKKSRTTVRGKGWKKAITIATDKYEIISRAIMDSLTKTPVAFSDLVESVEAKLEYFDGSIPWYTVSCLRELECKGR
jgi:L-fucose isomerase-like protein